LQRSKARSRVLIGRVTCSSILFGARCKFDGPSKAVQ
jgi:hypothetical protein